MADGPSQGRDSLTSPEGQNEGLFWIPALKVTVHSKTHVGGSLAPSSPTLRPEMLCPGVLLPEAGAGLAQAWEPQTGLRPRLASGGPVSLGLTSWDTLNKGPNLADSPFPCL